jgi:hypothetical protein
MLSVGTSCTVQSLKARPELNGRRGVVVSKLDEGGRVGVQVEGEDKPLSLKPANLDVVSADSAVQSVDSKTLARFVAAHSIRASDAAKRLFAEEMRAGVALGGSWCCSTSTLWCVTCAANLAYSGLEDEISDNIPKLLGLPPCTTFQGERQLPGELEAALHLVERVADGRKPLGRAPLPPQPLSPSPLRHTTRARAFRQKSASITSAGRSTRTSRRCCSPPAARLQPACSSPPHTLRAAARSTGALPSQEIAAHDRLVSREYTNAWGMRMLGACLRGRTVSSIASLASLAQLYSRAKLPHVGREIEEAAPQLSDALLSDWISDFDVEENGSRGWLTGLLCGYPVWTTAARYHTGGFELKRRQG